MATNNDSFKKPMTPSKRKLDSVSDPTKVHKSAKRVSNGTASSVPKLHSHVEDDNTEQAVDSEEQGKDEEQDDQEGRFFGGGVSRSTADVLDFIDERDVTDTGPEKIDSAWLRRTALSFERKISKNQELRGKFVDEPAKFMGSEADLDSEIKGLSILAEHPELFPEFSKLGCIGSLVSLLSHENTDIAIDALEILAELTDEDVEVEQSQWDAIVEGLLDSDFIDLLLQNIERLDEIHESDRAGVYHSLALLENLAPTKIAQALPPDLFKWLLKRIQKQESLTTQNKQYAAEVLAITLQTSSEAREIALGLDAVDIFLQLLSAFRKRDPNKESEEEEYAENLFGGLTCLLNNPEGKNKFIEAEGVELALIMLREGKFSKPRALRLLNHAMTNAAVCERLVEAAGLKTIFGVFMKQSDQATTEHILGIFASLLRLLSSGSAARIRTLAKFIEKDYEKIDRLLKLRSKYTESLAPIEKEIKLESRAMSDSARDDMEAEWLSRRLDAGLYCLQTIDVLLAWLVAEDVGARARVLALLAKTGEDLNNVKETLRQQRLGLETGPNASEDDEGAADMLQTLIECLD